MIPHLKSLWARLLSITWQPPHVISIKWHALTLSLVDLLWKYFYCPQQNSLWQGEHCQWPTLSLCAFWQLNSQHRGPVQQAWQILVGPGSPAAPPHLYKRACLHQRSWKVCFWTCLQKAPWDRGQQWVFHIYIYLRVAFLINKTTS